MIPDTSCDVMCKESILSSTSFPGLLGDCVATQSPRSPGYEVVLSFIATRTTTSVPGPSRWDGDEDPGKIRFIVPKFWGKNRMRSETQPYSTVIAIRLCRTAHAIFFPKFWNYKTNFTRVFVTVSPRRPWDRGCAHNWITIYQLTVVWSFYTDWNDKRI